MPQSVNASLQGDRSGLGREPEFPKHTGEVSELIMSVQAAGVGVMQRRRPRRPRANGSGTFPPAAAAICARVGLLGFVSSGIGLGPTISTCWLAFVSDASPKRSSPRTILRSVANNLVSSEDF